MIGIIYIFKTILFSVSNIWEISRGVNCLISDNHGNEDSCVYLYYFTALLMGMGALVDGPYTLITTAVSADLGTHKSLRGNAWALATITAIIDGTGSIGMYRVTCHG